MITTTVNSNTRFVSYLELTDGVVTDVGEQLPRLTGYPSADFINKTVADVFSGMLHCTASPGSIERKTDCFLFTADRQAIKAKMYSGFNEERHLTGRLVLSMYPAWPLRKELPFFMRLLDDNKISVGIYATGDFILLQANQCHLNSLSQPYNTWETAAGKRRGEIAESFAASAEEKAWQDTYETGHAIYRNVEENPAGSAFSSILVPVRENVCTPLLVSVQIDISELTENKKRIEAQNQVIQEQMERLNALLKRQDRYYAMITHELKTPLAVTHSALQTIEMVCWNELPEKTKTYLRYIKQNTFRQIRLINNLLDIARLKEGRLQMMKKRVDAVMLTRLIVDSVKAYADQHGVSLLVIAPANPVNMAVDDEKLERILLNLLSNAIKFTPAGKAVKTLLSASKETVSIRVEDEGIGIPADKLDMIFELFSQLENEVRRQSEGSGIGLALVMRLVKAMNGSIRVESEVGKGSAFTVSLPMDDDLATDKDCGKEWKPENERITQAVSIEFADIYFEQG